MSSKKKELLLFQRSLIWFIYLFACLTDYWDGVLARFQKKTSKLGTLLDPLADKILITSLLILLVGLDRAPFYLVAILIIRDLSVTGLRSIAASEGIIIKASSSGKLKTFSQMFAVGFLIIHFTTLKIPCHAVGVVLLWIATISSIWSGYKYFQEYFNNVDK